MSVRLRSGVSWCKLPAGELVLGRHETCTLQLDDPRLSRQHARLLVSQHSLTIEDLGSANGVHVNGARIDEPTPCHNGDRLVIGPFSFEVEIEPDSACPAVLEGSLLEAELSSTSNDGEFMPSTDRHGDPVRTVIDEPDTKPNENPLTPNPADTAARAGGSPGHPREASSSNRPTTAIRRSADDEEASTPSPSPAAPRDESSKGHPFESADHDTTTLVKGQPSFEPQTRRKTTVALMPRDPRTRIRHELGSARWQRLAAGVLDGLGSQLIALLVAAPCLIGGYLVALRQAKATVIDGAPLVIANSRPASLWELGGTLFGPNGWNAIGPSLDALRADHRQAFLVFFVAATAAVLAWLLVTTSLLVAATMVKGGPYWHRRLGLSIRDRQTGLYCSPGRSALRWLLAGLFGWMAPVFILLALPSPHDQLSRCVLRRRTSSEL